ncbi:MAG: hypothetical protein JO040_11645 [Gemmatimonadetes bacterium]|nr:hypothetical protein [Gemmatimonadota bacterium]
MFNWLLRKRLSGEAKRKLMIAAARSEEAIIETHVANALDLLEDLGDEVDLDRGIELYLEMMAPPDPVAAIVANRVMARTETSIPRGVVVRGGRFENVFRDDQKRNPSRRDDRKRR